MIKKIIILAIFATVIVASGSRFARNYYWDISSNRLNALTSSSQNILARLDDNLIITLNSANTNTIDIFEHALLPYLHASHLISTNYKTTSSLDTIELAYKGNSKSFELDTGSISEQQISSFIHKVVQQSDYWIAFLSGHGETDPFATDASGLNSFTRVLQSSGIHIAVLNLTQVHAVPNNVNTLAIVNPQRDFIPLEKDIIHQYIEKGGNILWFTEPDSPVTETLAKEFNISLTAGVIVDPASLPLGSPHPALKIITNYPEHDITKNLQSATVLPWSGHLQVTTPDQRWQYTPFFTTNEQSWIYPGPATADINLMQQQADQHGPLNIGIALKNDEQRIIIFADSSFVTNKYLTMYANQDLATNMLHWIDDKPILNFLSTPTSHDLNYSPTSLDRLIYNYLWIFLMPLLLIGVGFCIRSR